MSVFAGDNSLRGNIKFLSLLPLTRMIINANSMTKNSHHCHIMLSQVFDYMWLVLDVCEKMAFWDKIALSAFFTEHLRFIPLFFCECVPS